MRPKQKLSNLWFVWRLRRAGVDVGFRVQVSRDARVGHGTILRDGVGLGWGVAIGSNCLIGPGASLENITVGDRCQIEAGVICTGKGAGRIVIGSDSYVGIGAALDWSADLRIGNFVHIAGPSTGLWTHSSAKMALEGVPLGADDARTRPVAPVVIGDNVYIGGNCTIYPGVKIGPHAVVAPNSAVAHDVPPRAMVGGVPALVIKQLF